MGLKRYNLSLVSLDKHGLRYFRVLCSHKENTRRDAARPRRWEKSNPKSYKNKNVFREFHQVILTVPEKSERPPVLFGVSAVYTDTLTYRRVYVISENGVEGCPL